MRTGTAFALKEKQIQRTICDLLHVEGWRIFQFERQWSDKKRKAVGETGMPDILAIRYALNGRKPESHDQRVNCRLLASGQEIVWIEVKRLDGRGATTKPSVAQLDWHRDERARGALTVIAGVDFPATIEGFQEWYRSSGLERKVAA